MAKKTFSRDKAIGERLRYLRLVANMSQKSLSNKLGISPQQLQKYEKGINKISASRVEMLAEFLDVPVAIFFDNRGDGGSANKGDVDNKILYLCYLYNKISSESLKDLLLYSARVYSKKQ